MYVHVVQMAKARSSLSNTKAQAWPRVPESRPRPVRRSPQAQAWPKVPESRPRPVKRSPKAQAWPRVPESRPKAFYLPSLAQGTRKPAPACKRKPRAAGPYSAPKNRPRPEGRPPPRRFAVFGPVYPKASPGPLLGTLLTLTDPGAPLRRRTRPGAFSCAPRVSEK